MLELVLYTIVVCLCNLFVYLYYALLSTIKVVRPENNVTILDCVAFAEATTFRYFPVLTRPLLILNPYSYLTQVFTGFSVVSQSVDALPG